MKLVKSLMKQGVDKGEIFARAVDSGLDPKKVSRYLSRFPDEPLSRKFHKVNIMFLFVYGIFVLLNLWAAQSILIQIPAKAIPIVVGIGLIIPSVLMYLIYKKHADGYMVLALFLFKGVIDQLKNFEEAPIVSFLDAAIVFTLLVFVVLLKKKLFPYQNFFNIKKTDHRIYIFSQNVADEYSQMKSR